MKNKRLFLFSSVCTYLCFLGLVYSLKKPLCIDSMVVQKIDRVSFQNKITQTESAFSCHLNRPVEFSADLEGVIDKVRIPLEKTVALLNSIKPFKQRLQITIREDRPLMFQVNKNKIILGTQMISSEDHLSRAVIKSWVAENKNSIRIDTTLFDETLTDFLLYILSGKVDLEDPSDKTRTKLGSVKWPQVIKSGKSYCQSAWKYAEHIEDCHNQPVDSISDVQASVYSLRPLLTSSVVASYQQLSLSQKSKLIRSLPTILISMNLDSEKMIESLLTDSNPLHNGILNINKFNNLILSATAQKRGEIYQFYTGIADALQQYGVTDSFAEAYFDYLVDFKGQLKDTSSVYKNLAASALKNPDVQVAVKDDHNIWILPSKTALPIKVFNQIQARQIIFMSCETKNNIYIEPFFKKAEKLMLLNDCNQNHVYDFDSLLQSGIKAFIRKNHHFNFVQLHVPSLEMMRDQLSPSQNFFELVKNRDIDRKEFKALGWSKLEYQKDLQAYRPEAIVDAIQYFRN